jgi:Fur family ferric uptake transcriptional regulator
MQVDLSVFHKNGFRLTKPRQKIIGVLTDHPQSIAEICHSLKRQRQHIDQVTVYRSLVCLMKMGIVAKTNFQDNGAKYELLDVKHHHHHLVCEKCGLVQDIPIDDNYLITYINKSLDFKVTSHCLEFFGLCRKCQVGK